jgi:hypothetical protein
VWFTLGRYHILDYVMSVSGRSTQSPTLTNLKKNFLILVTEITGSSSDDWILMTLRLQVTVNYLYYLHMRNSLLKLCRVFFKHTVF